jgi:uncharacterized protein YbbC (DUF1343 family)
MTLTGLDRVAKGEVNFEGARVALLAHPASVTKTVQHASEVIHLTSSAQLRCLIGPQHGWFGDTQDNMIEWEGDQYKSDLPMYSLYGKDREPTEEMLTDVDTIIVDLQDVGCRVYTFIQTLYLTMKSAQSYHKKVIVLDRPNPIGNVQEGPWLSPNFFTFVGLQPIALRHGYTIGELATAFQKDFSCELEVIKMEGYDPNNYFDQSNCPWVFPSPNMPSLDTAIVYPGTVLFEATNISEGRGTTKPFELIGSPSLKLQSLSKYLAKLKLPGILFRETAFEPTFHKFKEQLCYGVQLHVTDRRIFLPVLTGMALIHGFQLYDPGFKWLAPPYEYEYEKMPIDILAGSSSFRDAINEGCDLKSLQEVTLEKPAEAISWENQIESLY